MSELEPEITEEDAAEPAEPADDPVEPEADPEELDGEPDDDLTESGEEPDADPSSEAAPGVAESRLLTERELEKRAQKLDAENTRHAKRVGEIMEDDAADLIPCPVCMDTIAGWVYPPDVAEPSPEQVSRIRQFAGLPDYTNFRQVPWAHECSSCGGLGKVITGSKVMGAEVTGCRECNERGWINTGTSANGTNGGTVIELPATTGPTIYGTNEPDERVAALRAEGYTVIPALAPPGM